MATLRLSCLCIYILNKNSQHLYFNVYSSLKADAAQNVANNRSLPMKEGDD